MTLIDGRIRGEEVEIPLSVYVPYPNPFGSCDDDVERVVVVSAVALLERNEFLGLGSHSNLLGEDRGWESMLTGDARCEQVHGVVPQNTDFEPRMRDGL